MSLYLSAYVLGPKNEVRITYFEKTINSALAVDVVVIVVVMSRHLKTIGHFSIFNDQSMS